MSAKQCQINLFRLASWSLSCAWTAVEWSSWGRSAGSTQSSCSPHTGQLTRPDAGDSSRLQITAKQQGAKPRRWISALEYKMSLSLIITLIGDNNSYQQSKMRRYYKVSDNAKRDTFLAGPRHSFFQQVHECRRFQELHRLPVGELCDVPLRAAPPRHCSRHGFQGNISK